MLCKPEDAGMLSVFTPGPKACRLRPRALASGPLAGRLRRGRADSRRGRADATRREVPPAHRRMTPVDCRVVVTTKQSRP